MTTGQELALRAETALATPADVVAQATAQADSLMDIVIRRDLFTQIGNKKFLQAEAWQIISSFNETSWVTDWVRPIELKGEIVAYEAKVNLMKRGEVVGAAIMSCGLDDDVCKSRTGWDKHKTAMSAAETWAGAKASRMKFAWVAVLAGFSPTPAEEMIREKEGERAEKRAAAQPTDSRLICPDHNVPLVHRQGTSKEGKAYDGYFCPTQGCKHKVWADSLKQETPKVVETTATAAPVQKDASVGAGDPATVAREKVADELRSDLEAGLVALAARKGINEIVYRNQVVARWKKTLDRLDGAELAQERKRLEAARDAKGAAPAQQAPIDDLFPPEET